MSKSISTIFYLLTINNIPCTHKSKLNILKRLILKNVFKNVGNNVNVRPHIRLANGKIFL